MPSRTPTAAHVIALNIEGQRRQFIATSAGDLARQIKATCPHLPGSLADLLARVAVDHQGSADLPNVASIRHLSRLAAEERPARPRRAAQGLPDPEPEEAGAGLDAGRHYGGEASSPAPAPDAMPADEAAQDAGQRLNDSQE